MPMYQQPFSNIPAPLADLMQVASMETPEGQPTVAAQYAAKAQQAMAPVMPQVPMMPAGVQDVARDAAIGNAVAMGNQQRQQQEMMQMLQQLAQRQSAQDSAMRFGVAAAPGAESVRMAEGGIVGYAGGDLTSERLARIAAEEEEARRRGLGRFDPKTPEEARQMVQARADAQARLSAAAPAAAPAAAAETAAARSGVMSTLGRMGSGVRGGMGLLNLIPLAAGLFYTSPEEREVLEAAERERAGLPPKGQTKEGQDYERQRVLSTYRDVNRPEFGFGTPPEMPPAEDEIARAAAAGRQQVRLPDTPQAGIVSLQAPTADRTLADAQFARAAAAQAGMETERAAPEEIIRRQQAKDAALAPYMLSMGADPDQYKKDIALSEERRARRLAGIGALEAQSKEARTGINSWIELFAGGAGRFISGGLAQQHVNMLRRDLAENERFLNARERAMEAEDQIQAAIREKRRAEVTGNIKAMEEADLKDRDARNAKRQADIVLSTELAKALDHRVDKVLDRQTQVAIENLRAQVHREATKAQQEGTLETRRANILANLNKTEESAFAKIDDAFNKRTATIVMPGTKPTKEQQQELQDAAAERDLAKAGVRKRLAETREEIMSMGSGGVTKVERVK